LDLAGEVVRHSKSHRSQDELLEQELTATVKLRYLLKSIMNLSEYQLS